MEHQEKWLLLRDCGRPPVYFDSLPPWNTSWSWRQAWRLTLALCFSFLWILWSCDRSHVHIGIGVGNPGPVYSDEDNPDTLSVYRHHFRKKNRPNAAKAREVMGQLCQDTVGGVFQNRAEDFDDRCNEIDKLLSDSVSELDGNVVPHRFANAHQRLWQSYGDFGACLEDLKNGYYAHSQADRLRSYNAANRNLQEGWSLSLDGENQISTTIRVPLSAGDSKEPANP